MKRVTTTESFGIRRLVQVISAAMLSSAGFMLVAVLAPATATAAAAPMATPTDTDQFNLRNVATKKCADIPGFGRGRRDGPVQQYNCDYTGKDNQEWRLIRKRGTSSRGPYLIQNRKDGYCLDLPFYGKVRPGTPVSEYTCNPKRSRDNQEFFLVRSSTPGYYKFVHVKSPTLCLDVAGFRTGGNNARLTLWTCSKVDSKDDHLWELRTGTRAAQIDYAIAVAKQEAKKHPDYAWGGGHGPKPGPSRGYCDSKGNGMIGKVCVAKHRIGYDCSGLMRYVFARATGWDWGNLSTGALSANRPAIFGSTIHRVGQLKRGDLVLLGTGGGGVNHTGIISRVDRDRNVWFVEAPNTRVKLREARLHGKFIKAYRLR